MGPGTVEPEFLGQVNLDRGEVVKGVSAVSGATNEGVEIVLQCLDVMLTKRRRQVSQQRALAFIKRLCTLALHVLPNSSIGILATNRTLMHVSGDTLENAKSWQCHDGVSFGVCVCPSIPLPCYIVI